jgi:ankyrin repeat protein
MHISAENWSVMSSISGYSDTADEIARSNSMIVNRLLDESTVPSLRNSRDAADAFFAAAEKGNAHLVNLLLKNGVDVDTRGSSGRTALSRACMYCRLDVIRILLEAGADTDVASSGQASLLTSVLMSGRSSSVVIPIIHLLVAAGARVDAIDTIGRSCLHMAALVDADAAIPVLALAGAGHVIDNLDNVGYTALVRAIQRRSPVTVTALLDAGANPNKIGHPGLTEDAMGWTPLMTASSANDRRIAQLLVDSGADTNIRGENDETAVFIAARAGYKDMVALLAVAGADLLLHQKQGLTLAMVCARQSNSSTLELVLERINQMARGC